VQADLDLELLVMTARLAGGPTGASTATEEAAEHVEGVVVAAAAAAVAMRLEAIVAVAVVDGSGLGVAEHLVCFGDFDELVVSGVIAAVEGG
jgi:hypothetical protein